MAVQTSAGSTLAISATAPATYDAAGITTLAGTATLIGEVTDIGDFGRVYNVTNHNPLATRRTVKKKASFDDGSVPVSLGLDDDDAGQILATTALDDDASYYFIVTLQDGSLRGFSAQVSSFSISVGSVDTITSATMQLEIDNDVIFVAAP